MQPQLNVFALLVLLAGGVRVLAEDRGGWDTDQGVVVRIGNYAGVEARSLTDAVRVAQSVLGQAGVQTHWRDCTAVDGYFPCADGAASRAVLAVKLFGRGQTRVLAPSPDALGVALLPRQEGEGLVAIVFVEEVKVQAWRANVPLPVVLGHTMAHEVGHLLLGTAEHAPAGLMQARWSSGDLAHAARGQLRFSEEESSRLRAAVLPSREPVFSMR
jgi:hypothetical protein